jgi:hypothetical protein
MATTWPGAPPPLVPEDPNRADFSQLSPRPAAAPAPAIDTVSHRDLLLQNLSTHYLKVNKATFRRHAEHHHHHHHHHSRGGNATAAAAAASLSGSYHDLPLPGGGPHYAAGPEERYRGRSVFGLRLLDPTTSSLHLAWTLLMLLVDATYSAFAVPLTLAFGARAHTLALAVDLLAGLLFTANVFLGFHVCFVLQNGSRKRVVRDGRRVALIYLSTYTFWIDLLAVVPFLFQLGALLSDLGRHEVRCSLLDLFGTKKSPFVYVRSNIHEINLVWCFYCFLTQAAELQAFRLFRLIRVVLLVRGILLGSYTKSAVGLFGSLSPTAVHIGQMIYLVLFLVNALACLLLGVASQRDVNWLMDAGGEERPDLRGAPGPRQYLSALYFAFTTVTTTGYGDLSPKNSLEQGICILLMSAGVVFFAFLTSTLTQALSTASINFKSTEEFRLRMDALNKWFRKAQFPPETERRIR